MGHEGRNLRQKTKDFHLYPPLHFPYTIIMMLNTTKTFFLHSIFVFMSNFHYIPASTSCFYYDNCKIIFSSLSVVFFFISDSSSQEFKEAWKCTTGKRCNYWTILQLLMNGLYFPFKTKKSEKEREREREGKREREREREIINTETWEFCNTRPRISCLF